MDLKALIFSDLFVTKEIETSWFKETPDSMNVQQVPFECEIELEQLRKYLDSQTEKSEFRIDWPNPDGLRLRVKRIQTANARVVYVCRRFGLAPGSLTSLGMPPNVANKLLGSDLQNGLVVFLGKTGSGKTTAAASFIKERLSMYGGVCWTAENPIELELQGRHERGWCYQTEVDSDEEIGPAIKGMLRATPNIIFIGELRESKAVREAIAAGNSGQLVVATFHSADLITGIARLVSMAGGSDSSSAIADALRVAIHLTLHNTDKKNLLPGNALITPNSKGTGTPPRLLLVEPIWITGEATEGLKSVVRNGDLHMLTSEVERQRRIFMNQKLPS